MYRSLSILLLFISFSTGTFAQKKFVTNGEWWFSWGYNAEWYSNSDIHVNQPSLNSDYTFVSAQAHDHIGWDKVFDRAFTIPQYNYRLGYFFNEKQDWGIEINFDHTKYIVTTGVLQQVSGKIKGRQTDSTFLTDEKNLKYWLNNGANFLLFNIVRRANIYTSATGKMKVDYLAKLGIMAVIPHVENTLFGDDNSPHFQFGGWNTGFEMALRAIAYKHYYIEYSNKIDYASYSGLHVYEGTAMQSFWCYEIILSAGFCF